MSRFPRGTPTVALLPLASGAALGAYLAISSPARPSWARWAAIVVSAVAAVSLAWLVIAKVFQAQGVAPALVRYRSGLAWCIGGVIVASFLPVYAFAPDYAALGPAARWYILGIALAAVAASHWALLGKVDVGDWLGQHERLVVGLFCLVYAAVFAGMNLYRWHILRLGNVDSAIVIQSLRYTLEGGPLFFNTLEKASHLGVHSSPIYFLLVPLYAAFRRPDILLSILPPVAIGASAYPFYLLARRRLATLPSLLLTAAYLLAPYMAARSTGDLYEMTLLPAFLVTAMYFYAEGHLGRFALFAVLALLVKESIAATVLVFALPSLILRRRAAWVVTPLGLGAASLALSYGVIFPAFGGAVSSRTAALLGPLGPTLLDAIRFALRQPGQVLKLTLTVPKLGLVYQLYQPLLFALPLPSWPAILALPALALNLVAQGGSIGIRAWESAIFGPLLFGAAIWGIDLLSRQWRLLTRGDGPRRVALLLAVGVLFSTLGCVPYWLRADEFSSSPYLAAQRQAIAMIPPEASLSAPDYLMAHVAERDVLQLQTGVPFWAEYTIVDQGWIESVRAHRLPEQAALEYEQLIAATEGGAVYQGQRRIMAEDGIYVFRLEER